MSPLAGRVAIVTGSARNIGRATAEMLAEDGAAVMIHARADREGVDDAVAALKAKGAKVAGHLADLDGGRAQTLMQATVETLGATILVSNAAVRRNTPLTEMTFAEWRTVLGSSLDDLADDAARSRHD
ncbi:MAG: SDR family NAD(P)-dependent oxidoreductase [Hyphomicrobiaceae bacterium]